MSTMFREFGAGLTAFSAPLDARLAFIRRTYLHLSGAVLAFAALSAAAYSAGLGYSMIEWMQSKGPLGLVLYVVGFVVAAMVARGMAHGGKSEGVQYSGLGLYVVLQTVLFAPILAIAADRYDGVLPTAAGLTVLAFGGLSAYVLTTKKDFSFLAPALLVVGLVMVGAIACGWIFGFSLGTWFSALGILFAMGVILYQTSNVLHSYRTDQHVGAALQLFAAVVLLFLYVLDLLMRLQRR